MRKEQLDLMGVAGRELKDIFCHFSGISGLLWYFRRIIDIVFTQSRQESSPFA